MKHERLGLLYRFLSALFTLLLIGILLYAVSMLPAAGDANHPANNEVAAYYLTQGPGETGARNAVTAMILDYRAFDTLGELCVLFLAACSVAILLRQDPPPGEWAPPLPPACRRREDPILTHLFIVLVPTTFMLGAVITLAGHLSPGGGFAGGAIFSAGLLLFFHAYPAAAEGFLNRKRYTWLNLGALGFYLLAKGAVFLAGANGWKNPVPVFDGESFFSAGLILPLNLCVALVVATTLYGIYLNFRKGGFDR